MKRELISCENCRRMFEPQYHNQKNCSRKCSEISENKRMKEMGYYIKKRLITPIVS